MNNSTTEYSKLLQKLDIILHDDNLNNNERRDQIVNEIINPLYDKAFDLILEKDKLEKDKVKEDKFEEVVALDLQVGDHFFFRDKEFVVREKDSEGCEAEVLEPDQLWEGEHNYLFILEIVDKKL